MSYSKDYIEMLSEARYVGEEEQEALVEIWNGLSRFKKELEEITGSQWGAYATVAKYRMDVREATSALIATVDSALKDIDRQMST